MNEYKDGLLNETTKDVYEADLVDGANCSDTEYSRHTRQLLEYTPTADREGGETVDVMDPTVERVLREQFGNIGLLVVHDFEGNATMLRASDIDVTIFDDTEVGGAHPSLPDDTLSQPTAQGRGRRKKSKRICRRVRHGGSVYMYCKK